MRTTVSIDKSLLSELMSYSGTRTKTAAVSEAIKEQIRRSKLKRLANRLGSIDFDEKAVTEAHEPTINERNG